MLSSITWGQYFSFIAFLLLFYYGYVAYKYYKWQILGMIGIKKVDGSSVVSPSINEFKSVMVEESQEGYFLNTSSAIDVSPLVHSFTDELKAYLQEAEDGVDKGTLLSSIKQIASKYPVLRNANLDNEICQVVYREVNNRYQSAIQLNEVQLLWE